MIFLRNIYRKNGSIHHAYVFEGEKVDIVSGLLKFLEKDFGVETKNNPDFSYQEFETFTIDDGRALREMHGRRAISGKKIFVISTQFVTIEAQNSLLKIFEEPSEGAHFFLIMPNTQVIIPTLRSRLVVVDRATLYSCGSKADVGAEIYEAKNDSKKMASKFLLVGAAERLSLVKNIIEEKDKGKAIDFVSALEEILSVGLNAKKADVLAEILIVKKYLHDRAPSVKLLLEHLCLFVTISKP